MTHDRLISRCKEVFGGLVQSIGRNKQKKKALAFDKTAVKEAGESFEVDSEIKILDQDETFEDTDEDQKLWGLLTNDSLFTGNKQSSATETTEHVSLVTGTNPDPKWSKNEGFDTNDSQQNTLKSLAMGTNGPISNHMAENGQKLNDTEESTIENSHENNHDIKNITTDEESNEETHISDSTDIEIDIDHNKQGLVPKSKSPKTSGCDLRNQEGADKFRAEVEELRRKRESKSKVAQGSGGGQLIRQGYNR